MNINQQNPEQTRMDQQHTGQAYWDKWGPYVSERQWGTVREDYSVSGNAWEYFPHEHARSRAYRWGEDGIAGFSDSEQFLCLGLALWNHQDPILKERLFGLTNAEGNHGEDVKEYYYYLDATPSHSYLKMLYKYPQKKFPYDQLLNENKRRNKSEPELELIDTGVFSDNRYFDVFVEYAKNAPEEIVMQITVFNRGPENAELTIVPQLWFRNNWSWHHGVKKPQMRTSDANSLSITHPKLGEYEVFAENNSEILFTENETNHFKIFGVGKPNAYSKDAFHRYIIDGETTAVNPKGQGTKAGFVHRLFIESSANKTVTLRLKKKGTEKSTITSNEIMELRRKEADLFYSTLQCDLSCEDSKLIQRQAFAGMIWSKQFYSFDVEQWLQGDENQPPPPASRKKGRNKDWKHLNNGDIISMPDKWEYPWYAAWDLAFHCLPLALLDAEFAKHQLDLLTREWYMHPNGQLPAYEWAFGDVNPPVHAWATWRVFQIDRAQKRERGDQDYPGDIKFLERVFHKMLLNFTWWVNRKDAEGRNIFQGGFLGLDNIGVFDRSAPLPTGGYINQSDGTSWMAMYSLNLLRISMELSLHNSVYEDIATKFFEHFLHIAEAMTNIAGEGIGLWDDDDKFYYDVLNLPNEDGGFHRIPLRLRSLVGLIPLFAVETLEPECIKKMPGFENRLRWILENKPKLANLVSHWEVEGRGKRRLLSLLRGHRMKKLFARMLDESEFLSDYGIRGLSKHHEETPYVFEHNGQLFEVKYTPAESNTTLFGGNSNWRGPIWFPVNYLLIESMQKFHHYYGDDFKIECPTGSGNFMTILEASEELSRRLCRIFLKDETGNRPVFSHHPQFKDDPNFQDNLAFYEYFHGDSGRGVGASHQTGWTGLIAKLLQPRREKHHGKHHDDVD
ncbi:MAG: glucosidase [Sumerlaeia bacterium]